MRENMRIFRVAVCSILLASLITFSNASCPELQIPAFTGTITYSQSLQVDNTYPFLTTATLACATNEVLTGGDSVLICLMDGTWFGDTPFCATMRTTCSTLPSIMNGNIVYGSPLSDDFAPGTTASYSCSEGYGLTVGDFQRTCEGDPIGAWSGTEPQCEAVRCGDISDPVNGQITYDPVGSTAPYDHDTIAYYTCYVGFGLADGNASRVCGESAAGSTNVDFIGHDGTWSGIGPRCDPITCPNLSPPANGSITQFSNGYNDLASYDCDTGFGFTDSTRGSFRRRCTGTDRSSVGFWTGVDPVCEPTLCHGALNVASHGEISYSPDGTSPHVFATVATITYRCDGSNGFQFSDGTLTSIRTSTCVQPTNTNIPSTFGVWTVFTPEPSCFLVMCNDIPNPANGRIDFAPDTLATFDFATTGTYVCDFGFGLRNGDAVRSCDVGGSGSVGIWTGTAPICDNIICMELMVPLNGRITYDQSISGSFAPFETTATFSCDPRYGLVGGNTTRVCGGNGSSYIGSWTGYSPMCEVITCPTLPGLVDGVITYSTSAPYELETVADYSCDVGFGLPDDIKEYIQICSGDGSSAVGEWNGTATICEPATCPSLADPANGDIVYSEAQVNGLFPFATNATYTCDDGYGQRDGIVVRLCQNDRSSSGEFDGSPAVCEPITCDMIQSPMNGVVNFSTVAVSGQYSFGTTVMYDCDTGFGLNPGQTVRTCSGDGSSIIGMFDGAAPTCDVVTCDLPSFLNGNISYSAPATGDGRYPYGSTATYSCDEGFSLMPSPTVRTCLGDTSDIMGEFDGSEPFCEGIVCPMLQDAPGNGSIQYSNEADVNGNYEYGTRADYECDTGFGLVDGVTSRQCEGDGSTVDGEFVGSSTTCEPITCPGVPSIANGIREYTGVSPDANGNFPYGATALYRCDNDFSLSGVTVRRCLGDGSSPIGAFDNNEPVCDPVMCVPLQVPMNGAVNYSMNAINDTGNLTYPLQTIATFTCNFGFFLSGGTQRSCITISNTGVWTDSSPVCQEILCPVLSPVLNGEISYSPDTNGSFTVGTVANYSCDPTFGIAGGDSVRTCEASGVSAVGVWTGTTPTCDLVIICDELDSIPNAIIIYDPDTSPQFRPDSTARYQCNTGFGLTENITRICTPNFVTLNGSWSEMAPSCEAITCEPLDTITDGSITYATIPNPNYVYGTSASYSCESGFGLSLGDRTRTCEGDGSTTEGSWTGIEPVCQPIECSPLMPPSGGSISYSGPPSGVNYELGTMVTYSCDQGLAIMGGDSVRVCRGDGSSSEGVWHGQEPTCQTIMCPDIADPDNGQILFTPDELAPFDYGTEASYSCSIGYGLTGNDMRTCSGTSSSLIGEWTGTDPTCTRVRCSPLEPLRNGTLVYSDSIIPGELLYDHGVMAMFDCDIGFGLSGNTERTCQGDSSTPDGQWSGSQPTCEEISCLALEVPMNGLIIYTSIVTVGADHGTTARYMCDEGYGLNGGDRVRTCSDGGAVQNGQWNGTAPLCSRITCSALTVPLNARISYDTTDFDYGTTASYSCDVGYGLSGSSERVCTGTDNSPIGEWNGAAPDCNTRISCPELPAVANGVIDYSSGSSGDQLFGVVASYSCDPGFGLTSGDSTRSCDGDGSTTSGSWTGTPAVCQMGVMCPVLMNPLNGSVSFSSPVSSGGLDYGTTALFSCSEGFGISGDDELTCEGDGLSLIGEWSGSIPDCQPIQCADLSNPMNGVITFTPDEIAPFDYETVARYSCDSGFGLTGMRERSCGDSGTGPAGVWSGSEPSCGVPITCGVLPSIANGQIVYSEQSNPSLSFGATATYVCDTGYGITGGDRVRSCDGDGSTTIGQWSGSPPVCLDQIVCPLLMHPNNGQIVFSQSFLSIDVPYGTRATFICSFGYGLVGGSRELTCGGDGTSLDGEWSSEVPLCEAITCDDLADPVNGQITFTTDNTAPFDFLTTAIYGCEFAYVLTGGSGERVCIGDSLNATGQWNGTAPTCEGPVLCPDLPALVNGSMVFSSGVSGNQLLGTTVSYECDEGFSLEGGDRECVADGLNTVGQWSSNQPNCTRINCPVLPQLDNGQVFYSSSVRDYGSEAVFLCSSGFGLTVDAILTCTGDGSSSVGQWDNSIPSCEVIQCPGLPNPVNGLVVFSPSQVAPFDFATVATYQCNMGYSLVGDSVTSNCYGDGSTVAGQWSNDDPPTCEPIVCEELPVIGNSNIQYSSNQTGNQLFGVTATYACEPGFDFELLAGDVVRTCSGDGSSTTGNWTGVPPTCVGITLSSSQQIGIGIGVALLIIFIILVVILLLALLIYVLCKAKGAKKTWSPDQPSPSPPQSSLEYENPVVEVEFVKKDTEFQQ